LGKSAKTTLATDNYLHYQDSNFIHLLKQLRAIIEIKRRY